MSNHPHVIQFTNLDDLLDELPQGAVVRVATLDVTERTGDHGIRLAGLGVHVRAINDQGHVLACYIPAARLQMLADKCLSDPGGDKGLYDQAVDQAQDLAERIKAHIAERSETLCRGQLNVRPGVIDIGQTRPLAGAWHDPQAQPCSPETS